MLKKSGTELKKPLKKWAVVAAALVLLFVSALAFTNAAFLCSADEETAAEQDMENLNAQCILVLGARVNGDVPGDILKKRLETGIDLYKQGAAPKLFLTGDGGEHRYDEVSVMQRYALEAGVPKEDIIVDREGFDTYSSVYRAGKVYGFQSVIIVTQAYHMPRALYDARALGLDARGTAAQTSEKNQWVRSLREIPARAKDYVVCMIKPKPSRYS